MTVPTNPVLEDAIWIEKQACHAKVNEDGVCNAADNIIQRLSDKPFTPSSWAGAPLHPNPKNKSSEFICNWIFLVSSLNFSFWSDILLKDNKKQIQEPFGIWHPKSKTQNGEKPTFWKGYWSLLAVIHRAINEGYDIINPKYYATASREDLLHIFRSDTLEPFPLLEERLKVIWDSGKYLCENYDGNAENLIKSANSSAMTLVHNITSSLNHFNDVATYNGRQVHLWKRAQIFVAETWAAFGGQGLGTFTDIGELTMFADYRVPQNLLSLGSIAYSEDLIQALESKEIMLNGSLFEVELRAASIVAVDEIKKQIFEKSGMQIDSIVLDFELWDQAKEKQTQEGTVLVPHHLTRSVFY